MIDLAPKTGYLIIVVLLLTACTLTPQPVTVPPAGYQAEAQALLAERRYTEALAVLERGAAAHPGDTNLLLRQGQIYLALRRWFLAEDAFNRTLARDLENVEATMGLAETLLQQGRYSEALKVWQQAARLDPDQPGVFTGLGRTWLALFRFEDAQAAFLEQQTRQAEGEAAWYLAALTAPLDVTAAQTYLQSILAGEEALSTSLASRRDYLAATLAPFDAGTPPNVVAQATGIALVQVEQWPLAIHALEAALEAGANAETVTFLAHARAQAGQPAFDLFAEAKRLAPASALPLYFEGQYLQQQGALNAAENRFEQALERDPENAAIYFEMARTKELRGDLATAEIWYQAAVEVAEDKATFQRALVRFYMNRTYNLSAGIDLVEQLLADQPGDAELQDALGWLRFLSGEPDGGRAALQEAIRLDPTLVSARYHLARYYEANRQSTAARSEYQRVIDWDTTGLFRDQAYAGLGRLEGR